MSRYIVLGVLLLISLLLESTVLDYFKIAGTKPDLLLLLVVFSGLLHGHVVGAKTGFIFGLVEDLYTGSFLGLNAVSKMLVGYLVGWSETKIFKENLFIPALTSFVSTFLANIIYIVIAMLAGIDHKIIAYVWHDTLTLALFNACLAPFFYGKFYQEAKKGVLAVKRY
ncbi:rod shape-determining protein MreD [Bacillota bacterium LX-D]|nr:rod shape-determining protein MreD [Bacillota bacterium LX-D]